MTKVTVRQDKNVLGGPLLACSYSPLTGFLRDGCCSTGPNDLGRHVVCAKVTREFLEYQLRMGNDLISPVPQYRFAGLKPGDRWCVCAGRWKQAHDAGVAPPVYLEGTNFTALEVIPLETLLDYAIT
ncbi:DUF2237 family protein [Limnobacter parvus]|uniref:DUF2237 domain-containing protein n=1 Tax=Limnobacter parvus TaxID=2939690 RepID=A0ABT1XK55_9BURK|nr:DUF2237 domain-containing protein [Limnobacter parvus]MCR2747675.1 DUF2237 domain-containing protein [Limnobacter parvus]